MTSLDQNDGQAELTILMPCLNEAETVATCVRKAVAFLTNHCIDGEVVVADNGSTDNSRSLAFAAGARIVEVTERGDGAALLGGIIEARGKYIIMGDADDSYDFSALMPFVERLRAGADLVMGNRFQGGIAPGAMPALHRYLGNPVLSFIGRLFFKIKVGDFHCGLRGFRGTPCSRSACRRQVWSSRVRWSSGRPWPAIGWKKCRPRCRPMAVTGRRTCAVGAMAGVICAFFCCSARAGCSFSPAAHCCFSASSSLRQCFPRRSRWARLSLT